MSRLLDKTSLVGILLLIIGLVAGVFLVQQSQEFRERAGLKKEQMIVVCHRAVVEEDFWEEIEVLESELKLHIDHGDLLGNCPDSFKRADLGTPERQDQVVAKKQEQEIVKISLENSNNQEVTPTIEEAKPNQTPTPTPQVTIIQKDATFRFFIKLQGIEVKRPARLINVSFNKSDSETHIYKNVRISPNSQGVYFGQLDAIPSGRFEISFKTDTHLRRAFQDIKIEPGLNTWYFENNPLLAGDFNDDNVLDINDIALILAELSAVSVDSNEETAKYDVDVNASIDQKDLDLVLENYQRLNVKGD